jgi:hypothetical protein
LDIRVHDKVIKIIVFSCFLRDSLDSILIWRQIMVWTTYILWQQKVKNVWSVKLPWTEYVVDEQWKVHDRWCQVYTKIKGKKKLLALKLDNLWKHEQVVAFSSCQKHSKNPLVEHKWVGNDILQAWLLVLKSKFLIGSVKIISFSYDEWQLLINNRGFPFMLTLLKINNEFHCYYPCSKWLKGSFLIIWSAF